MNACKQTQALLFDNSDGRIESDQRAAIDAHLAACPHCKQVFATWASALPRLRGLSPEDPSAVSLRRMENEVLGRLRAQAQPHLFRFRWFALASGLALAVLVVLFSLRATAPQPFAHIQTLWGRVTFAGLAMSNGATIAPGGVLEIAGEGEASFLVGRAAEVRLSGPARVAFDGTSQKPRLRLDSGRLAVEIAHRRADEGFAVLTAQGRIEVRGTRFVVAYAEQNSYVHVEQGEVAAYRAGDVSPSAVKAGDTFWFARVGETAPPAAADEIPPPAAEPRPCPPLRCSEAGTRARKAMRAGNPARAVELVEQALGEVANCAPAQLPSSRGEDLPGFPHQRCLDELGYLRAEALRQSGRLEAAITAFRSLNRPTGHEPERALRGRPVGTTTRTQSRSAAELRARVCRLSQRSACRGGPGRAARRGRAEQQRSARHGRALSGPLPARRGGGARAAYAGTRAR